MTGYEGTEWLKRAEKKRETSTNKKRNPAGRKDTCVVCCKIKTIHQAGIIKTNK
jgi:hypothetical protein